MALNIYKAKGRKDSGSFVKFPHRVLEHPAFMALGAHACKVILFLASQYNGSNNGDLTIAWKVAKAKGLTSNGALRLATKELMDGGFVIQTRQGGRNRCSLFALTWFPINECDGKLDVPATSVAPNDWLFKSGKICEPPGVQSSEPPAVQCGPPGVQSSKNTTGNLQH